MWDEFSLQAYGERGWLLRGLGDTQRLALLGKLEHRCPPGCVEFVGGADSLLFLFREATAPDSLRAWLGQCDLQREDREPKRPVRKIPVRYDGPDLATVAEAAGLSVAEVIERHAAPVYTVRMMGFAPGFPYLDGLDPALHLPRKESPRNRIEPGAVAIGGPHAGVYSVASPGGWHLLGRTQLRLFKPEAARGASVQPSRVFLLSPGDRLRFHAVD
ncbi:MAG: 5-oxoprolinase subunit B family protein [Opitutales bacterium]